MKGHSSEHRLVRFDIPGAPEWLKKGAQQAAGLNQQVQKLNPLNPLVEQGVDAAGQLLDNVRAKTQEAQGKTDIAIATVREAAQDAVKDAAQLKAHVETNVVDPSVDAIQRNTKRLVAEVGDGVNVQELLKNRELAAEEARLHFGLSLDQYINRIRCPEGGPETADHFFRTKLSPANGRAKRLVIMIGGNNENLTLARDASGSYRMQTALFDEFRTDENDDVDVIQFRCGMSITTQSAQHNSVAWIHIQEVVRTALAGQSIFAGRTYSAISQYGHSYGAGAASLLNEQLEQSRKTNPNFPPVDRTVFMDGVEFESFPPRALRRRPASQSHFHIWQTSDQLDVQGAAPLSTSPGDQQLRLTGITHRSINEGLRDPRLFQRVYAHLLGRA